MSGEAVRLRTIAAVKAAATPNPTLTRSASAKRLRSTSACIAAESRIWSGRPISMKSRVGQSPKSTCCAAVRWTK
jgi:hypothetical protein